LTKEVQSWIDRFISKSNNQKTTGSDVASLIQKQAERAIVLQRILTKKFPRKAFALLQLYYEDTQTV
jgi:hypothetical protein